MQNKLQRVIDANLNRSREALRVCEDITRFVLEDKPLTASLKNIRHKISKFVAVGANGHSPLQFGNIVQSRNAAADIGKKSSFDKSKPKDFKSLFYNNIHRAEESMRALEEFSKLYTVEISKDFKTLRFKIYTLEKKALKKLQTL
jgi:thiamine-phosphate pyrophosphorylase